jgi:tRNA nucleotidyltransferase (CCA-adding enzyme)
VRVPRHVRAVLERLWRAGHQAYPVGGCVRDVLLGRKVGDWDVTTSARPERVLELFPRVVPTGLQHGTLTVICPPGQVEVTTFRGEEGYSDGRHPDRVVFLDSLEEDLKRRDFTINAMAYDLEANRLRDPFDGQGDLARRVVRAVGQARERFSEDGLRPLRAVRFATLLGFDIHPETLVAIPETLAIFRRVAPERVRLELLKLLASPRAARGVELLRETGLLEAILPELLEGVGHLQNRHHRDDIFGHALACLRHARGDAVLKLAVLMHDAGKPRTAGGPPGEHTFYGHERVSAELADAALARLRFSRQERERVRCLIANHMFHYEGSWTDGAVRRLIRKVGVENLPDLWAMRLADARGRGAGLRAERAKLAELQSRVASVLRLQTALKVTDLQIDGRRVMEILGIGPGPAVGQALDYLLERVLDDPALNTPESLQRLLRELPSTGALTPPLTTATP